MKNKNVTIYDIAEKTNFSAVTVHRALNNKGRISDSTKNLILKTAKELGYKANPAAQGLRRNTIKIGAILFCPVDEYVNSIIEGIEFSASELEKFNVSVKVKKIPFSTSGECLKQTCAEIDKFIDKNYNGIILFVSSAVEELTEMRVKIEHAKEKGIAIGTVANDALDGQAVLHVGIDARKVGSMAAEMLEFTCKNKEIAILSPGITTPISHGYLEGFSQYASDSTFAKIHIFEHFDNKNLIKKSIDNMLTNFPNVSGVYISSAISTFACQYIEKANRRDLTVITTDILTETSELLKRKTASATLFQNPFKQGREAITHLYNYITAGTDKGKHLITPQIILSSNVDSYLWE